GRRTGAARPAVGVCLIPEIHRPRYPTAATRIFRPIAGWFTETCRGRCPERLFAKRQYGALAGAYLCHAATFTQLTQQFQRALERIPRLVRGPRTACEHIARNTGPYVCPIHQTSTGSAGRSEG